MGFENLFHYIYLTAEVFVINLLLSGDNAVVISLACRDRPAELMRRAMTIGIGGAIALRILLTTVAGVLLHAPLLKLVGGVALTIIAIKLTIAKGGAEDSDEFSSKDRDLLWPTVGTIIVADLVMSVDNVVALAAVAQGNVFFLTLGLLMSVPLLIFGSVFVTALLKRYPLLIRGGGAMLGWIAGDIAISDPLIADWVNQQSPALSVVVPALVVVFVLFESRIMEGTRASANALRPARRPKAATPAEAEITRTANEPVVAIATAAPIPQASAQPERGDELPSDEPPPDAVTDARPKRSWLSFWIIVLASMVVFWLLFKLLSLDFTSSTPALQFTRPTGGS
jgi:YjbE family integral membrane protein